MDSKTQLYCIFGNPVKHSKSPVIHNACFKREKMNAVYLAFEIAEISKAISAMKTLNIKGASITIPFKESIMSYLDQVDENARNLGAVNTIINKDGKLFGYNTDYAAAIASLNAFDIKNKNVWIIGAGGAAQAVAYGIHKEKGKITILNRNKKRGKSLALKYRGDFICLDKADKIDTANVDILINTTSIGMSPEIGRSPVPSNFLHPRMVVMDIVYTPLETRFISEAKNKGCKTIDGLSMFLNQGAAQFALWTGITPDIKTLRNIILNGDN